MALATFAPTGVVQFQQARKTSVQGGRKKTSGLSFHDFCCEDAALLYHLRDFEEQILTSRVHSLNVREECFLSEIIPAKISGENH